MSLECSVCERDIRGGDHSDCFPEKRANAGLDGVPIGLDCSKCGEPITVDFMAHGTSGEALLSEAMLDMVKAAGRAMFRDRPALCSECNTSGQRGTAGPTTTEPPVDQTTSGS